MEFEQAVDVATRYLFESREARSYQIFDGSGVKTKVLEFDKVEAQGITYLVCQTHGFKLQSIVVPATESEALDHYQLRHRAHQRDACQNVALRYFSHILWLHRWFEGSSPIETLDLTDFFDINDAAMQKAREAAWEQQEASNEDSI